MGWAPRTKSLEVEQTLLQALPHIKWADLDSHGFNVVNVNRERVQVEWWFVDTVLQRTSHVERGAVYEVKSGCPELDPALITIRNDKSLSASLRGQCDQ